MAYVLVNFGGPRDTEEVCPFLTELLTDRDVVRAPLPSFLNRLLFRWVARKRSKKIAHDYQLIGGKSPIFDDTEALAEKLRDILQAPVLTFHRYLPATHALSLQALEQLSAKEIRVIPLFPQFTYATTGSIARFFERHLSKPTLAKLRWVASYPDHPSFVFAYQQQICSFLKQKKLAEEETILLFSAHGVPQSFVAEGDPYEIECQRSFHAVSRAFPKALCRLSYQSKFGPGEWLRPYTDEACDQILSWNQGRKQILVVPIAFTSDHIETLFEIEYQYLPILRQQGLQAFRCPALNLSAHWIEALAQIATSPLLVANQMLIRKQ